MKEFAGKVAMITGAAHGIGYSFALEAVRRGMKLALVDIDAPALEAVAAECREMGAEVLTCETDVSVYEEAKASVQATMDRYGQIDVLFANAGIATAGSILHIPIRDWEWALAVNTMGIVHYVHEVLPIMEAQKTPAHLMCTASIAGLRAGMAINPPYFCSKHAAVSVAESVKAEVEPAAWTSVSLCSARCMWPQTLITVRRTVLLVSGMMRTRFTAVRSIYLLGRHSIRTLPEGCRWNTLARDCSRRLRTTRCTL